MLPGSPSIYKLERWRGTTASWSTASPSARTHWSATHVQTQYYNNHYNHFNIWEVVMDQCWWGWSEVEAWKLAENWWGVGGGGGGVGSEIRGLWLDFISAKLILNILPATCGMPCKIYICLPPFLTGLPSLVWRSAFMRHRPDTHQRPVCQIIYKRLSRGRFYLYKLTGNRN